MTTPTQSQNTALIAEALKNSDVAKVAQAYAAIQPFVPAPAAVPVVKSHVAAGGNATA
jgi:hypothetical protein